VIVVDKLFGLISETLLLLKRSYCAAACERLAEMNVDRRTSSRLDSLQLPRRRYVKFLHSFVCLRLVSSERIDTLYTTFVISGGPTKC